MTTQSWNTRIRHDSDAFFREWGSEFSARLAAAGLVQTADTGQINWASVVRGSIATDSGYEVWRMNDTQQATAPVFFKIYYGTAAGGTDAPRIRIAVGIASNGSGVVTTIGGGAATIFDTNQAQSQNTDALRNSYLCVAEGFVGWNWKTGIGNATESLFMFCRSSDSNGTPTAEGAIQVTGNQSGNPTINTQAMRFAATAALYTTRTAAPQTMLGFFAQGGASGTTLVGADFQVCVGWMCTPRMRPAFGICGCLDTEVVIGNQMTVALVGATPRNYIALSSVYPFGPSSPPSTTVGNGYPKFGMLWE